MNTFEISDVLSFLEKKGGGFMTKREKVFLS